jgi:hypothetical protein
MFTWGRKPRLHLSLPPNEYTVAVAFDPDQNYVFIFMKPASLKHTYLKHTYVVVLVYKRDGDDFVLSHAGVYNLEVKALLNEPPNIIYAP